MTWSFSALLSLSLLQIACCSLTIAEGQECRLQVSALDSTSATALPCRAYLQNLQTGEWLFPASVSEGGSAVEYRKQLRATDSVEMHATLSAHPFEYVVPPGQYRLQLEYGKEYTAAVQDISIVPGSQQIAVHMVRFADMNSHGWYSGDTHVHRDVPDLANLMLAENLNVAFPITYWVRDSLEIPAASGPAREAAPFHIDDQHFYFPVNTEYEIFSVNRKSHTQGAVFVLNHRTPLQLTSPPVTDLAAEARLQGALLELDKHSWAWSMMIAPVMKVDLFELSNNHNWRTRFGFPQWTIENAPHWPEIERNDKGLTELGWTEFAHQTYYALLNCGLRMRITGGTGSGVHPVPLGHSRVYVHCGDSFSPDTWLDHLNAGHSFVTTGPLMDLRLNGELPGHVWSQSAVQTDVHITGTIQSDHPLRILEVVRSGRSEPVRCEGQKSADGSWHYELNHVVTTKGSEWIAVRCFEDLPEQKISFAHTNPVFLDVPVAPLKPRKRDAEFFIQRMNEEIRRNSGILSEEAVGEYHQARKFYEAALSRASEE